MSETRTNGCHMPQCLRANGEDAMVQGWTARMEGYRLSQNPRLHPEAFDLWAQGWRAADEEMGRKNARVLRRAL
jgi:hypothetical protein